MIDLYAPPTKPEALPVNDCPDLRLEPGAPIFPSNEEILAYLKRYAQRFDILSHVRYERWNRCIPRRTRRIATASDASRGTIVCAGSNVEPNLKVPFPQQMAQAK